MSNPAIVLMTDPSRCNLGDVHHLVQALLEIQQMGQHAIPQAFCDHPAAAREFIDAYAHAYPQLVLEDREIPTPGHLHSLITTGQIGALGRPPELAPQDDMPRPFEQNGANVFPIVVLTLGSSQVLLDALRQSPTMRESIRLIDVGQDGTDAAPVSIADAVAIRGLDGQGREHESRDGARPELDEIAGASTIDAASLTLHDDRLNLDMVETEHAASEEPAAADEVAQAQAPVAPASTPTLAPVAVSEPIAYAARSDDGFGAAPTVEPVIQMPAPVEPTRSIGPDPAELAAPLADQDLAVEQQAVEDGDHSDQEVVDERASPGEEPTAADEVAQAQAPVAPASTPTLAPVAVSEPIAYAARSDDGFGAAPTVEPVIQMPAPVEPTRSIGPDPAELAAPLADQDLAVEQQAVEDGDHSDQEVVDERASPGEEPTAADEVAQAQAPVAPASTPTLAPVAVSEPIAYAARSDDGFGAAPTVEPVIQMPAPVESTRSIEPDPAELAAPLADQDLAVEQQAVEDGDHSDQEVVDERASPGEEPIVADEVAQAQAPVAPASTPTSPPVTARSSDADPAAAIDADPTELLHSAVPALETTAQVVITRPSDAEPIAPEAQAPDPGSAGDGQDGQLSTGGPAEEGGAAEKKGKEAGQGGRPPNDDVYYPPVGSLIAGADVLYPALDQAGAHGALRELASVLLDDGLLDADLASELLAAHRDAGLPAPARQGASAAERASEKVVTFEDFYAALDQDSEDSPADAGVARPPHDSDL